MLKSSGINTDLHETWLIRLVQVLKVVFICTLFVFYFSSNYTKSKAFLPKPYAWIFAINASWFIVSKALQRSISTAGVKPFLSSWCFHFSINQTKEGWVLNPFL